MKKNQTNLHRIGVPQGSSLEPLVNVLYTLDLLIAQNTITETFADDTAIVSYHEEPHIASDVIQSHRNNPQP